MATRIRRTPEQVRNELKAKLQKVESKMKDEARRAENHRAIILGKTLQARANGGNANAKRELDDILDGLTRDQDRRAFGLDLLPGPAPAPVAPAAQPTPVAPPAPAAPAARQPVNEISHRVQRAVDVWNLGPQTAEARAELAGAIIAMERVTREVSQVVPVGTRSSFGIGPGPGELLTAS